MIIDGKAIAAAVLARAKARAEKLPHMPRVVALAGADTPATRSYLKIKERAAGFAGCAFETRPLGADTSDADAVIVQLPVPEGVSRDAVLDAIPLTKDADVLSHAAREQFETAKWVDTGCPPILPPVVAAIAEIFAVHGVAPEGKPAAVLGRGFLVGAPAATWLAQKGAQVTVLDIDTQPEEFSAALRAAAIVVSGTGIPHLIKPAMLKEAKTAENGSPDGSRSEPFRGVVLIDAGTSELGGKLTGDADPACAEKCSLFTPVPGGIGPVAVAMLFENATLLAERNLSF